MTDRRGIRIWLRWIAWCWLCACVPAYADAPRLVTLAPHLTELVYAAGAGDRLVGTVAYSDYPRPARALARVGDAFAVDYERLVALRPDWILVWDSGMLPGTIRRLQALGIGVSVQPSAGLRGLAGQLEAVGRLTGTPERAALKAQAMRLRLQRLERRFADAPPRRVFYQFTAGPLYTIGGSHYLNEVLGLCHAANVFAAEAALVMPVTREAVLAARPDVIVIAAPPAAAAAVRADWSHWPALPAVRDGRIVAVDPDLLHRPGPRLLDGAERLCRALTGR